MMSNQKKRKKRHNIAANRDSTNIERSRGEGGGEQTGRLPGESDMVLCHNTKQAGRGSRETHLQQLFALHNSHKQQRQHDND